MKKTHQCLVRSSITAALSSVALFTHFATPSAIAGNLTWVGGYGTTGVWSQGTQWAEGTYANASDVIFNNVTGTSSTSTFLGGGKTVKSITFNGGTPSPAFNIRLATSGAGGTAAALTFISTNTGITIASTDTASHTIGQSDGNIVLQGNLLVTHNGSGTLTLSRPVTGAFSLTKTGTGLLVMTAANTYNGDTIINAGKLRATVGGSSANSEVVINNVAATFSTNVTDNTLSWTCSAFTPAAAGTLEFNFGAIAPSASVAPLVVTNAADFTTATPAVSVLVNAPGLIPGTYPLMTWGSTLGTAPSAVTVSNMLAGTEKSLSLSLDGLTLNLVISSTAASIVKANNATDLNLGGSWVGGVAPATTEVAKWTSAVTSANTTVLGADLTWAGIAIENPTGLVTINAGHTLTLGAAAVDIDLSTADTADLTLNCPLALGAANTWNVAASRTLTLGGQVSGAFGVTKVGAGTALLSSTANNYTGTTTVTTGTLKLGASEVIPNGAATGNIAVAGTLDLNGNSETVNGLSGAGIIDNTLAATSPILTVGANDQTSTFSGVIQNTAGTLNLTKTGTGTLTLSGANTFTGSTTVSNGTLIVGNASALGGTSGISLAGGTTLTPSLSGINLSAPITLGATGTSATITAPNVAGSGTTNFPVTLSGGIGGDGNVILRGIVNGNSYGRIDLNAANNYAGSTLITTPSSTGGDGNTNIFVRLGVDNALPVTTVLTLDGGDGAGSGRFCELNLNGNDQTLAGLTNVTGRTLRSQEVYNTSGTAATLTVNNTAPFTYAALIGGGASANNLGLTKSGAGIFTISGANTYTGATTITGGTLTLGANNVLPNASAVSIGAATLAKSTAGTETAGTLEVTGAATINLGTDAVLAFADSSSLTWSGPTLQITGPFVSGTSLRFGDGTGTGLTPAQLLKITATGYTGFALNGTGYLTATETGGGYATWAATNAGGQGSELDFDGDGVRNGVEFFLNAAAGFTANPVLNGSNTITWTNGGNIPASAYGTQFVVQTSANLVTWTDVLVGDLTTNTDGPGGALTYTLTGVAPRFVRLKVMPN